MKTNEDTRSARTKPRLQQGSYAKVVGVSLSEDEEKEFDKVCQELGVGRSEGFRIMLKAWRQVLRLVTGKAI